MIIRRWMIIPFALAAFIFLWWRLGGKIPPLRPSCTPDIPVDAGLFTFPPVDIASVTGVIPLGNLNPGGGHVLAVDHMYLNYPIPNGGGSLSYPVYNMAVGKLFMLTRQQKSGRSDFDYQLYIRHTCNVYSYVDHLHQLSPIIDSYLTAQHVRWIDITGSGNGPWISFLGQPGGPARLSLSAGEQLGITKNYSSNWDIGVVDTRQTNGVFSNPAHYSSISDASSLEPLHGIDFSIYHLGNKTVNAGCFIDYMNNSSGMRDAWRAKLLSVHKTCGRVGWDTPGHLRGSWFNPALDSIAAGQIDANQLAAFTFIPDNFEPDTKLQVAIANASNGSSTTASLAALDPFNGTPSTMAPQIEHPFAITIDTRPGSITNPDPATVGPGTTVCYDLAYGGGASYNTLYLHMTDATHLKIKYLSTPQTSPQCGASAAAFPAVGSDWVTYIR